MRDIRLAAPLGVACLILLSACNQDSRVPALEQKIAALENTVSTLQQEHDRLKQRTEMNEMFRSREGIAYLTPGSTGYAILSMDLTKLTVSLADIQPYANGSKVTMRFGNLSSATIDGLKATLEWGPVDKDGTALNKKQKSREISFNESLWPGAWNNTEVILEGIPPTALGFIRVKEVSHQAIRMRSR